MTHTDTLADRHVAALQAQWEAAGRGPPAEIVIGTFRDAATLTRWHPEHMLESHRALTAAVVVRLSSIGVEVQLFEVRDTAYCRWLGRRPDTRENRARYIGQRGANIPWRLGAKIGAAEGGRFSPPRGGALGWVALDLAGGYRFTASGVLETP